VKLSIEDIREALDIVGDAAVPEAAIVAQFGASADHPVALNFPEGEYLKGLLVRKAA